MKGDGFDIPAAKAARRSSIPKVLATPVVKTAKERYCMTND